MKSTLKFILLLAVFSVLTIVSAFGPGLEQRQGQVIDTTPTVGDCASSSDCKSAAFWWFDCQRAHVPGQLFDPSSNIRSCLCPPGHAVPSHIDWYSKLHNCIVCVEMAIGKQSVDPPLYLQIEQLAGSPSSNVGYCHGTLSTQEFIKKTKDLVKAKNFPLELPEAILRAQGGNAARSATPITDSLLENMHSSIALSISSAFAHSEFTQTDSSSAPTAVFNSQFSTFSAVPMESLLTSIATATTAGINGQFVSFSPGSKKSVLTITATVIPTPVPNSQFSTFSAVPMSSVLASFSTAISSPSATTIDSSKVHTGEVDTHASSATGKSCSHDNYFRQAIRSSPAVSSFCATYTKTSNTAPSAIPSYLSHCDNLPARVSSACSCLSGSTYSISITSPASSTISSATSLSTPSSFLTMPLKSNPTKWVTFPVSGAVKSCAASKPCTDAQDFYESCMTGNDEDVWNCLCSTTHLPQQSWKTHLSRCTQCLEHALPQFAGNGPITTTTESNHERFCQVTGNKTGAKSNLIALGASLTLKYQSPLLFFNMTLLTAQLHVGGPLPVVSPAPVALKWASLPASPKVVACAHSTECLRAAETFNTCAAEEKKQGGNVKFCFCNTHNMEWTTSLSTCATCIAKHLPSSPPSTAPAGRELIVSTVNLATSIYCEPASQGSIERLAKAGEVITAYLQSPVKFFDMSLVKEAFPIPK